MTPLGWLQLRHRPLRLSVAVAGIAFAVLLILMQLGFRHALFEGAVRFHRGFRYDIALFSTDSVFIVRPQPFSARALFQSLALEEVESVSPVHIFPSVWRNPWTHGRRSINTIGFRVADDILEAPGFSEGRKLLQRQDVVLFDAASRPEFGPVGDAVRSGERVVTEVNDREIEVTGLFEMGPSFGIDGSIMTSDDNFLRLFPERPRDEIQLGLVTLSEGADAEAVRDRLRELLPGDVLVLTKGDFIAREKAYWNSATPIGYVFGFGAIMGLVVGAIIVYQVLFADVSDHLAEYATLRALGYPTRFVSGIVLQQATVLGLLGYVPGAVVTHFLYRAAGAATRLPLELTPERLLVVLALTLAMCAISGLLALDKVRRLDPADVF